MSLGTDTKSHLERRLTGKHFEATADDDGTLFLCRQWRKKVALESVFRSAVSFGRLADCFYFLTSRRKHFVAQGPKGELERTFPKEVNVKEDNGNFVFTRAEDTRRAKAMHGLSR